MAKYRYAGPGPAQEAGVIVHPGDEWEFPQPPDCPPWQPLEEAAPPPPVTPPATPAADDKPAGGE